MKLLNGLEIFIWLEDLQKFVSSVLIEIHSFRSVRDTNMTQDLFTSLMRKLSFSQLVHVSAGAYVQARGIVEDTVFVSTPLYL